MRIRQFFTGALVAGVIGLGSMAALLACSPQAEAQTKKFKIYLSLSYSGNSWQSEAANIVKALAATPPYDQTVELTEVISGTEVQAQILGL